MKIGLQTWGSDGDIRPFIALAGGLTRAGHEVTLSALSVDGKDYSELAQALGFKLNMIAHEIKLDSVAKKLSSTNNLLKQSKLLFDETFFPYQQTMFAAAMQLCKENSLVVAHHIVSPMRAAAELNRCDYCSVFLCHSFLPTRYSPPEPFYDFGPFVNALVWKVADLGINAVIKKNMNQLRKQHHIKEISSVLDSWQSDQLNLVAVSSSICKKPSDWSGHSFVCGFFDVPLAAEPWQPSPALQTFLKAGEAPVYFTFGSMNQFAIKETTELMLQAARLSGTRAIVQSHWDQLDAIDEDEHIFRVSKLPHHYIFPHCAVVVHHGGAGTSHSSLRSGAASVVVQHAFDQSFWGKELQRIGVAEKVLNRRKITAQQLGDVVRSVYQSKKIRAKAKAKAKAKAIGKTMQAENGVQHAVDLIENTFDADGHRRR